MADGVIYRTLTGNIECTMERGVLFVRDYQPKSEWRADGRDAAYIRERMMLGLESKDKAARAEGFRFGCMYHCLIGRRDSSWYVEPKSSELRAKIRQLQQECEAALMAEADDRPVLDEVSP